MTLSPRLCREATVDAGFSMPSISKTVGLAATCPVAFVAAMPMSAALPTRSGWSSSHCHWGPLFGPELVGCHQVADWDTWLAGAWSAAAAGLLAWVAASRPSPLRMMAADFMAVPLSAGFLAGNHHPVSCGNEFSEAKSPSCEGRIPGPMGPRAPRQGAGRPKPNVPGRGPKVPGTPVPARAY